VPEYLPTDRLRRKGAPVWGLGNMALHWRVKGRKYGGTLDQSRLAKRLTADARSAAWQPQKDQQKNQNIEEGLRLGLVGDTPDASQ